MLLHTEYQVVRVVGLTLFLDAFSRNTEHPEAEQIEEHQDYSLHLGRSISAEQQTVIYTMQDDWDNKD